MQGPSSPWCVGSVFFPPQLLNSGVGPVRFSQVGKPLCLLSTGLVLEQDEALVGPKEQIQDFMERVPGPFVPRVLLTDHVQSEETISNDIGKRGNLLQGLKCGDGRVVLFFLCEDTYRVASTVCYQGSCGSWYAIQSLSNFQHAGDSGLLRWPVSVVLQHSVYQLSAVWAHLSENEVEGTATVAVRCKYHVYFITVLRQKDEVQLFTSAVSKFLVPVAHVTWNPHVCEEAAVILESGEVHLLDVKEAGHFNRDRVVNLLAKLIVKSPMHRNIDVSNQNVFSAGSTTEKSTKTPNQVGFAVRSTTKSLRRPDLSFSFPVAERRNSLDGLGVSVHSELQADHHDEKMRVRDVETGSADRSAKRQQREQLWWRCEYGWLLQTLLVANSYDVYLVNLTDKENDMNFTSESVGQLDTFAEDFSGGVDVVASVRAPEYLRFCFHRSRNETILAFGKCESADVYEFSVATEKHVTLFDVRQPCTPILQWEHGMSQDPPNLLIMCPMASLRSFDPGDRPHDIRMGRVILAANFRSGDIRVFCYGQKDLKDDQTLDTNSKRHKVDLHNWVDTIYAWDTPSRLYAPLSDVEDWADIVSSTYGLHSKSQAEFAPKLRKEGYNIAGLVLLPKSCTKVARNEKQCGFALLQLTGWGELLIQAYEASDDFKDPTRASISATNFLLGKAEIEPDFGCQDHRLNFESMPTFLKYMRTGSILAPHFSKDDTKLQRIASTNSVRRRKAALVRIPTPAKARCRADLKCDPEILIKNLNFPLSMYEVARRGLSMGLPIALSAFAAPLPSDLNMVGNKFLSISPLLRAAAFTAESAKEDDEESLTLLRSSGSEEDALQGTIPLPLLLELHNINRVDQYYPSKPGQLITHSVERGGCPASSNQQDDVKQIDAPFVDGQELLVEGSLCVETILEDLVSKTEPLVISLDDSVQDLDENSKQNGRHDSRILLYSLQDKSLSCASDANNPPYRNATGEIGTPSDVGRSYPSGDVEDVERPSRKSHVHIHHKFVTRGTGSTCTEDLDKVHLTIDPKLCPIELSFTHPGEELEQDELVALNDLQADFLLWQQGFSPYRRSF